MLKLYLKKIIFRTRLIYLVRAVRKLYNPTLSNYEKKYKESYFKIKFFLASNTNSRYKRTKKYDKKAIFLSYGNHEFITAESFIVRCFESAGYQPIIMVPVNYWIRKTWKLFGYNKFIWWDDFESNTSVHEVDEKIKNIKTVEELLKLKKNNIRIGKYAISSTMRKTRSGNFSLENKNILGIIKKNLALSIKSVRASKKIINKINPEVLVLIDNGYTPSGELFETFINNELSVISWHNAHKDNTLMFKRYYKDCSGAHPYSLSSKSWEKVRNIIWEERHWKALKKEIVNCYEKGQWYSEVGTQFQKKSYKPNLLKSKLKINNGKKTAIIFPHIFWDATFFWGSDLFDNYEDWFINTVKAAVKNKNLNWIIKIHPANVIKDKRDGFKGKHSEITAIEKNLKNLPSHIQVLEADTNISTISLYKVADYVLTVRGTPGIEGPVFGCTALTAGTGRYDGKGFTVDFKSRAEYLNKLHNLQKVPPISNEQIINARKFAYGTFILRPTPLNSIKLEFQQDETASSSTQLLYKSEDDLENAFDAQSIKCWIESQEEDYLNDMRFLE